ncbi:MAG: hypothetical protein ACREOZ_03125 [Gloeomargaritales cyanobacterium]
MLRLYPSNNVLEFHLSPAEIAYRWIQSWFWDVETYREYKHSLNALNSFLNEYKDTLGSAKAAIQEFVLKSLVPNEEMWLS